jgi:hypothetical protein
MSARAKIGAALVVALASAPLTGCSDDVVRGGSILHAPVVVPRLPSHAAIPLGVATPQDVRPPIERAGESIHTKLFFTVAVVTHWERSGNYVTDDIAATPDAPNELASVLSGSLGRAGAARIVPTTSRPAYVLETSIVHLYATHYAANEGTVVVIPGSRGPQGGGANVETRSYADYGNVVLRARLLDQQSNPPTVVWDETITGGGEAPSGLPGGKGAQLALNAAVADATLTLTLRVSAALERLGETRHARPVANDIPPVFLVERVSRLRDFVEYVTIDTNSGRALKHEILPIADRAYARPGEWLLSRRLPDGSLMAGDDYDAYAHKLAVRYDLRAYDDVERYHFFGVLGVVP